MATITTVMPRKVLRVAKFPPLFPQSRPIGDCGVRFQTGSGNVVKSKRQLVTVLASLGSKTRPV